MKTNDTMPKEKNIKTSTPNADFLYGLLAHVDNKDTITKEQLKRDRLNNKYL